MVHPSSVPPGAAGIEYRALTGFPFAISSGRKLYDLEGADVGTIIRMTVLRIPNDCVVRHQYPTTRPGNTGVSFDDGIFRVLAPGPHEFIDIVEAQSIVCFVTVGFRK